MIVPGARAAAPTARRGSSLSLLERELGVPVPVENRTGGSGVIGHTAIADAAPDEQTIGVATLEIGTMHHLGLTKLDGASYTPIGLYNADPAAIFVRTNGEYKDVPALLAALATAPDAQFKASGSAQGGVNQLALAGMLEAAGLPVSRVAWVPPKARRRVCRISPPGASTSRPASLPEGAALMEAGLVTPIGVFSEARLDSAPDVPTFAEASGKAFALGSWRGIVAPAGLSPEIAAKLTEALGKVVADLPNTSPS